MSDDRLDLMSPAFIAGFVGMAIRGDVTGFVIAAGSMWLFLFIMLFVDAFLKSRSLDRQRDAMIERRSTHLPT